jgi:hypothetical protein
MSPFGAVITPETLKYMSKYYGREITQVDCAREAMRLIHAEDKNLQAAREFRMGTQEEVRQRREHHGARLQRHRRHPEPGGRRPGLDGLRLQLADLGHLPQRAVDRLPPRQARRVGARQPGRQGVPRQGRRWPDSGLRRRLVHPVGQHINTCTYV